MSILIKGMKMPKCCDDCDFIQHGVGEWCYITEKNLPCDCPLIELPDHGDLVDADEVMKTASEMAEYWETEYEMPRILQNAHIIIPAERSEDEH